MLSQPPTTAKRRRRANTLPTASSPPQKPSGYTNPMATISNNNTQPAADDLDIFSLFSDEQPKQMKLPDLKPKQDSFTAFDDDFMSFDAPSVPSKPPQRAMSTTTNTTQSLKNRSKTPQKQSQQKAQTIQKPRKGRPTRPKSSSMSAAQRSGKLANRSSPVNANSNSNSSANPIANNKKKKVKKIDVLPLLHKGIRANKFKLKGNKSKVRKFYLTENNYFFCWDAVSGSANPNGNSKSSFFSLKKKKDKSPKPAKPENFQEPKNKTTKIDPSRSIPIRSIRSLMKNPAYTMQPYKFIPASQKSLTISIVYIQNGSEKRLNFMAYEMFHHILFYEGLKQLWDAAKNPNRNLSEVFELYVDFNKDALPKHLRPQKFKWEPLGASDYDNKKDGDGSGNLNPFTEEFASGAHNNVNMFDPTSEARNRMKSF